VNSFLGWRQTFKIGSDDRETPQLFATSVSKMNRDSRYSKEVLMVGVRRARRWAGLAAADDIDVQEHGVQRRPHRRQNTTDRILDRGIQMTGYGRPDTIRKRRSVGHSVIHHDDNRFSWHHRARAGRLKM